jgi:hypothetical protein
MDARDRQIYSQVADLLPIHMDADQMGWVRRPRLFWVDWKMWEDEYLSFNEKEEITCAVFSGRKPPLSWFLEEGATKVQDSTPFPTFTRSICRSAPPLKPAGIHAG